MIGEKQSHRRRHRFIKKEFQFKFIVKFCLLLLVGVLISTSLLLLFSQDSLTSSFAQSRLVIKSTGLAILPSVIYTNLIILGFMTLLTIIFTLFISHKIAGPLFRFEKELTDIGEGDLTRKVILRKNDQITEMAKCLNNMTAGLHEKVLAIQVELGNILKSASMQDTPKEIIERLEHLHQEIGGNFKI